MKLRAFAGSLLLAVFGLGGPAPMGAQQTKRPAQKRVTRIRLTGAQAHKLIKNEVPPLYPGEASKKRIQGTVRLHIIIGMTGLVNEINIVSGKPQLEAAAVDAVRQWQYNPSSYQGHAVEVETVVDIVFKLSS